MAIGKITLNALADSSVDTAANILAAMEAEQS